MLPINAFSIENFKSFGPKQRIPLERVNFIFGPNSGGKSSVLIAFGILMKALIKKKFNLDWIEFSDNSPKLFLGDNLINELSSTNFFKIACEHIIKRPSGDYTVEYSFELFDINDKGLKKFEVIDKMNNNLIYSIDQDCIKISATHPLFKNALEPFLEEGYLDLNQDGLVYINDYGTDLNNLNLKYEITVDEFLQKIDNHESLKNANLVKLTDKIIEFFYHEFFSYDIANWDFIENKNKETLHWIGSNRLVYDKSYTIVGKEAFIMDHLLNKNSVDEMNKWLRASDSIDLEYDFYFDTDEINTRGRIEKLKHFGVIENKTSKFLKFDEVGSGISNIYQILLPFFNEVNFLIIQLPENHLHPSLQVQLARSIFALSKERNIEIMIETHSEHFIKAAQLEIARGLQVNDPTLTNDDLSVLYVSKGDDGFSKVKQMEVDKTGAFTEPWPDDFFELSADLSLERLRQSYKSKN